MLWVYRHVNDVRGHAQWSARKDSILTPARIGSYNVQHRALYEAVNRRDMEGAVSMINAHLGNARADLLGVSR
jgi:DNA-binding GntR family transcriptional regulator